MIKSGIIKISFGTYSQYAFVFWIAAALLIILSGQFESAYFGALFFFTISGILALTVDSVKGYGGRYFFALSTLHFIGFIFVYLFWILPFGFEYFGVNQGFDPARFDYLARNSQEWSYQELGLSGLVIAPINFLYNAFGENIFLNGIFLNVLMSLIVLCADSNQKLAISLPLSILAFPDLLLLYNLPAKEGYTVLSIFSWYVFMYNSQKSELIGKLILLTVFVLCCIPRPHIVGVLGVSYITIMMTRDKGAKIVPKFLMIMVLSSIFYFLQGDRLSEISEYSAITRSGENTESIDETKGAVRNYFATDPASLLHFALTPLRFIAYIVGPFPTGGIAQAIGYNYHVGADGYAPLFAILNRCSFWIIAALVVTILSTKAKIQRDGNIMITIFIAGLVFASLYSPFLHLRYRIPFLPLLYLTACLSNIRFGSKIIIVALMSELCSLIFYLAVN